MSAYRGPASASGAAVSAAGLGAWVFLTLTAVVIVGALGGVGWSTSATGSGDSATVAPSAIALRDIPPPYLRLYERAGERYGLRVGHARRHRQGRVRPRA